MVVTCTRVRMVFLDMLIYLHALMLRTLPHFPGGVLVVSLDHLSKSPRRVDVSFVHIQCITWVTAPSEVFEHAC